jgi:hypothetical protein
MINNLDAYWNVNIHNLVSSTVINLAEIKVYYGTTQVGVTSYSMSSTFEYADYPVDYCFDGDISNLCHSSTSGGDTNPYLIFRKITLLIRLWFIIEMVVVKIEYMVQL